MVTTALFFDQIFIKHAGNQDKHKILDVFEFRPDLTFNFGVTRPWAPETAFNQDRPGKIHKLNVCWASRERLLPSWVTC